MRFEQRDLVLDELEHFEKRKKGAKKSMVVFG